MDILDQGVKYAEPKPAYRPSEPAVQAERGRERASEEAPGPSPWLCARKAPGR
jgi:hypothetical protein